MVARQKKCFYAKEKKMHLKVLSRKDRFPTDVPMTCLQHAPVISFTVFRISSSFGSRGGVRVKESLKQVTEWWVINRVLWTKHTLVFSTYAGNSVWHLPLKRHREDVKIPTDGSAIFEVLDICSVYGKCVLKFTNSYSVANYEEKGDVYSIHMCWIKLGFHRQRAGKEV